MKNISCPLCAQSETEKILWQDAYCRVIQVDDADYAGFCRVIWHQHISEMTDLSPTNRAHLMQVVFATEQVLRQLTQADKINLASLGNQVAHLHWHVIARFKDDRHFPETIWSAPQRPPTPKKTFSTEHLRHNLEILLYQADGKNPQSV